MSSQPIEKPELVLPYADPIKLREVKWVVINKDNYSSVFNDLEKNGQPVSLFALTSNGYENLSLNLGDIRSYIQQEKAIISAYKSYYVKSTAVIDAANRKN